jgi:protein-L-isoaspartate(D-aspartate) O-methyltransferase
MKDKRSLSFRDKREQMVYDIRQRYGLESPDVLSVMLQVPRHKFVDKKYKDIAYSDGPVPIGHVQTMSQPYTVAFMTSLLELKGDEKVLEIGTGSGYQAAVLSKLAREVYTVEIVDKLAKKAEKTLRNLGYKNVHVKAASGEFGWKDMVPFDAILITAGVEDGIPVELFEQLKKEGVLVAPVGRGYDKVMTKFTKKESGKIEKEKHGIFHFVPFVQEKN